MLSRNEHLLQTAVMSRGTWVNSAQIPHLPLTFVAQGSIYNPPGLRPCHKNISPFIEEILRYFNNDTLKSLVNIS